MQLIVEIEVQECDDSDIEVTSQCGSSDINITDQCSGSDMNVTNQCENLTLEITDVPIGGSGDTSVSKVADNRLERKPDGLYVRDRLDPDPVAYYLLSRG